MQISFREPGSAITHLIAAFLTLGASLPLLIKAADFGWLCVLAMFIFTASTVLLYGASAAYHWVMLAPHQIRFFRKLDHMMIFVLIAGSYTPVCLIVLDSSIGYTLLAVVWGVAFLGMGIKAFWITCPKWFSSAIYIAMGWLCLFVFGPIVNTLPTKAFAWLLAGGILYTIGGLIYAIKPRTLSRSRFFGAHEVFHLFVMGGSFCHFIFMYVYVAQAW